MTVLSLMKSGLVGGVLAVGCGIVYFNVGTYSASAVLDSLLEQGAHPVTAAMVATGQYGWEMHGTALTFTGAMTFAYYSIYYTLLEKLLARLPAKVYTHTSSGRRVMSLGVVAAVALTEAAVSRYGIGGANDALNETVMVKFLRATASGGGVQRIEGEPSWVAVPLHHPSVAALGHTAREENWDEVAKLQALPLELWSLPWTMLALRYFPVGGRIATAFWCFYMARLFGTTTPSAFLANVVKQHADEGDWTRRVGTGQLAAAAGGGALAKYLGADFVWLDRDQAAMYMRLPEPSALHDATLCDRDSLAPGPSLPSWLSGDRSVEELRAASREHVPASEGFESYSDALDRAHALVTEEEEAVDMDLADTPTQGEAPAARPPLLGDRDRPLRGDWSGLLGSARFAPKPGPQQRRRPDGEEEEGSQDK